MDIKDIFKLTNEIARILFYGVLHFYLNLGFSPPLQNRLFMALMCPSLSVFGSRVVKSKGNLFLKTVKLLDFIKWVGNGGC